MPFLHKKSCRLIPVFLVLTLMLSGCRRTAATDSAPKELRKWDIGVCQGEEEPYCDIIMDGFSQALSDELPDDSFTYTREYITDRRRGSAIMRDFVRSGDDLIFTIGEQALTAAGRATEEIPIITTDVIDISSAIDITELTWSMRTGRNVTGITGMPNLAEQLSLIIEVTPELGTIGILYGKTDTCSTGQITAFRELLSEAGIRSHIYQLDDDVTGDRLERICARCDAIFIPAKSDLYTTARKISKYAAAAGIPTIGGDVRIGANTLTCLCPDYYTIGYNAGLQAAEILGRDRNPARISIELNTSDGIKLYNKALAKKLGITFPKSFHEYAPEDLSSVFSDR